MPGEARHVVTIKTNLPGYTTDVWSDEVIHFKTGSVDNFVIVEVPFIDGFSSVLQWNKTNGTPTNFPLSKLLLVRG